MGGARAVVLAPIGCPIRGGLRRVGDLFHGHTLTVISPVPLAQTLQDFVLEKEKGY